MLCEMPCLPAEKGYGTARRAAYVVVDSGEDTKVCEGCAAELLIDVALGHVHDFGELVPLPWLEEETAAVRYDAIAEGTPESLASIGASSARCPECDALVCIAVAGPIDPAELAEKQRYHNIVEHGWEA